MTDHRDLPEAELHEPKGISTATSGTVYLANGSGSGSWSTPPITGLAAAPANSILVADGAGSATWTYSPQGFGYYKDSASSPATIAYTSTPAKLQIDGSGTTTETSYLPPEIRGSAQLWDTVNDKITPITVGDYYHLRIDLEVTAKSGSAAFVNLELDIGGAATPTIIVATSLLSLAKTPPFTISVGFPIFTLGTFLTNGGQIFLSADTGTATIGDRGIVIARNSSGDI